MTAAEESMGRYRIMEEIHTGTVSCLYKAYDPSRNEMVALKTLKPELSDDPEVVERFKREARVAQNLEHPNIIKIYDIGSGEHRHYFSMELIDGPSLRRILESGQILSIEKALEIAKEICLALHFAHQKQIIHRDIKPSNIMINKNGGTVVLDFGIAKIKNLARLTRPGFLLGTPEYMSPEQIKDRLVDGRSDIYSLGIVLYELLTGRVPFRGKDFLEIAERIVKETPPEPSKINKNITKEIDKLILKAINKERWSRFSSALEMANALQSILGLPPLPIKGRSYRFTPPMFDTKRRDKLVDVRTGKVSLSAGAILRRTMGFWFPSIIALALLLLIVLVYEFPNLMPLFLILVTVTAVLWFLSYFKPKMASKRYRLARLLLFDGKEVTNEFILNKPRVVIGRDQPDGIELFKETISRAHAQIINKNGQYIIYDLNSKNGTFVNCKRIRCCILKNSDRINIGGEILFFQGEE